MVDRKELDICGGEIKWIVNLSLKPSAAALATKFRPRASQGPGQGPARAPGPGQGPARARPIASQGPGQGASMHHAPCPAMNGHPRRDTDLILRPSESTIDFLSVFICSGSLSSVKMKVLNENTGFV